MTNAERIAILRAVSFLSELDEETLSELASKVREQQYVAHARIITELEFGADVYIIAEGEVEVSVTSISGKRQILGHFGPGASFGEMASLTGELRSATVRALTKVRVLIVSDRDFDHLRQARPELAVALLQTIGNRLSEAEQTLKTLLVEKRANKTPVVPRLQRSSLLLLWRDMVVNREKDLAFLTLAGFVIALLVVRLGVYLAFEFNFAPRDVLRAAYVSGFGLVIASAYAALSTFRPGWRRVIALAFGVGAALIINELGVTLAFDIFYKDIRTPDPNVAFDVEKLYRRTEPVRATVIGLLVLIQAAYLKSFYARVFYLVRMQLRHNSRSRKV